MSSWLLAHFFKHVWRFSFSAFQLFSFSAFTLLTASRPAASSWRNRKFSNHSNTNKKPSRSRSLSPRNPAKSLRQHQREARVEVAVMPPRNQLILVRQPENVQKNTFFCHDRSTPPPTRRYPAFSRPPPPNPGASPISHDFKKFFHSHPTGMHRFGG